MRGKPLHPKPVHPLDGVVLEVALSDGPVPVTIKVVQSASRIILRLDRRSGDARLTLPPRGVSRAQAMAFLETHSGWLEARRRARPQRVHFTPGTPIPVRGVETRILHRVPFRGETRLAIEDGEAVLIVHGAAEAVPGRVERFLRAEALKALAEATTRHAARLGVSVGRISIKDTRSRWGSCSARGDIAYSWRLVMAPPDILDYLAAHEVAHRLEMNHGPRYWRHVETLCPDFRKAEAWLTRNGSRLHLYGPA